MTLTNKPNLKLAVGIPLFIFLACFLITLSSKYKINQELLSNAILIDLLITAPLAYFLIIRKTTVSKLTVLRVFIAGLLVAGFILNDHSNILLGFIRSWVSPIIEALVIFFIGRKFYVANKKVKSSDKSKVDFLMYCRLIMHQVIGNEKIGNIISSEIAVLYYSFIARKDKNIDNKSKFTSYKENGILIVLGTFLSLFLIETTGVHFLLSLWSKTAAWILTGLSFYTCLQLFAHMKAIKARPMIINNDSLEVHNGLAGDAYIEFDNIERIEFSKKLPLNRKPIKIALIKGLENHNIIVYLKHPMLVTKIFGIKKWTDTVLFFVDKPDKFLLSVNLQLSNNAATKADGQLY